MAENEADNRERWVALLDENPIRFVNSIAWAANITVVPDSEYNTIPLVNIGGLWGTICADIVNHIDENAYKLICSFAGDGYVPIQPAQAKLHEFTETEYGAYPILLNMAACDENAGSFIECTSGPMGTEHCPSISDLQAFCGPPPASGL